MKAVHGRVWLLLAAVMFFAAWALMPGVGITDANRIFDLVGSQRGAVLLSSVLQLASAACYAPAMGALLTSPAGRRGGAGLHLGAILLLVGATGSSADAIFHLFAYEMTAPDAARDAMLPVMARMQGPGLVWILPLILCFFVGTALLAHAARRAGPAPAARGVWIGFGALLLVLAALAATGAIVPGRAVGLGVIGLVSAGQVRVTVSPLYADRDMVNAIH